MIIHVDNAISPEEQMDKKWNASVSPDPDLLSTNSSKGLVKAAFFADHHEKWRTSNG